MSYDTFPQTIETARKDFETLQKRRKSLENALMRVQPLLNKYIVDGHVKGDTEFKVCTLGPSCCKRGGIELLADMKEMAKNHPQAKVVESECLRRCGRGPNVEVGGIVYTTMTADKAKQLIETQVNSKTLAIDLLIDDEFAPEAVHVEDVRCAFDEQLQNARSSFATLSAMMGAVGQHLPVDTHERVHAQVQVLGAMKLHADLKEELALSEEMLKKVVPLTAFVDRIFARDFSKWQSNNVE